MSLHKELNFSSAVGSIADEACPGLSRFQLCVVLGWVGYILARRVY